jgi:hypothetical protein
VSLAEATQIMMEEREAAANALVEATQLAFPDKSEDKEKKGEPLVGKTSGRNGAPQGSTRKSGTKRRLANTT